MELSHEKYLLELTDQECNDCQNRQIARMWNDSGLLMNKSDTRANADARANADTCLVGSLMN